MPAQKGITTVLEGTNEDDLHVYRPGIRAIKELGIQSPLADAGLSKEQVRRMASEYGDFCGTKDLRRHVWLPAFPMAPI